MGLEGLSPVDLSGETEPLSTVHGREDRVQRFNTVVFPGRTIENLGKILTEIFGNGDKFRLSLGGDRSLDDGVDDGADMRGGRPSPHKDHCARKMVMAIVGQGARGALRWRGHI